MKVSRTVTYAVQALLQLSVYEGEGPVPCNRLAREGRMPERFLLQILRDLVNSGILRSVRGVEGGYRLARSTDEITLEDIFEAVDSPLIASVPPLDEMPDNARETLMETFSGIAQGVREQLRAVRLVDLLKAHQAPASLTTN
ncbi:HTH-type transcriptional regulator CymR [Posidoniimonas polymericola]|uniref:HTH-type transcriptional regulator CymR n=1 Tax=Posidoniimonas polymericola TaxID=2528002 RepID=A0A5C5XVT7_9BACT|nr:Rrf2 family transcriptional regulator [Posidoniimonas polymericola]TWT66808.1 HTH-type transcriptional regulator CymR [Posidoniimonas polymericola]